MVERRGSLIRTAAVVAVMVAGLGGRAQTSTAQVPSTAAAKPASTTAAPQPAQEESIAYLGRKLWFEVKRRLNLTTEEEEEKNTRDQQAVNVKLGGIRVQRPAPPSSTPVKQ
jgi:hypothetical protein